MPQVRSNKNMNNDFQNPFDNQPEYNFYDEIVVKDARRAMSRTHLGLFLLTVIPTAFILAVDLILLLVLGTDAYAANLATNVYYNMILGTLPIYLIGLPIYYAVIRKVPTRNIRNTGMPAGEFLALIPIAMALMVLGSTIGSLYPSTTIELISSAPIWLVVIFSVILAPLAEELIFRKLLIDRLSIYGNIFAIVVSAVSFGLFHGNLQQFFYAAIIGVLLGYVYVRSGNWLYAALMHAIMNLIGGPLAMIADEHLEGFEKALEAFLTGDAALFTENIASFMIAGSYLVIQNALVIAGIVLLILSIKNKWGKVRNDCVVKIRRERVAGVIFKNPGTIMFIVISALTVTWSLISVLI